MSSLWAHTDAIGCIGLTQEKAQANTGMMGTAHVRVPSATCLCSWWYHFKGGPTMDINGREDDASVNVGGARRSPHLCVIFPV